MSGQLASNDGAARRLAAGWQPGQSGNPKGRAPALVDIAALARKHGPKAIEVVVKLMSDKDSKVRLAAATALLDRGFGRPKQELTTSDGSLALHLLAAQMVSDEMLQRIGNAQPPKMQSEPVTIDAIPTE